MAKLPPWVMDSSGRMIYTPSGDNPWEPQLTPGADLAKRQGCTCSRLDNKWGEGTLVIESELRPVGDDNGPDYEFSVTPGCPLHDTSADRLEPARDPQDQRTDDSHESPNGVAEADASDH